MLKKDKYLKAVVMAIDTSINDCGVAVYEKEKPIFYDLVNPEGGEGKEVHTDQTVKSSKKFFDYVDKAMSVYTQVKDLVEKYEPDIVVVEVPEYYGVSAYLSRESGSLFKLTFVAGMLMTLPNATGINPTTWKGQCPKKVVQNRLNLIYPKLGILKINHNIVDAIGIGHWTLFGKI